MPRRAILWYRAPNRSRQILGPGRRQRRDPVSLTGNGLPPIRNESRHMTLCRTTWIGSPRRGDASLTGQSSKKGRDQALLPAAMIPERLDPHHSQSQDDGPGRRPPVISGGVADTVKQPTNATGRSPGKKGREIAISSLLLMFIVAAQYWYSGARRLNYAWPVHPASDESLVDAHRSWGERILHWTLRARH